MAAGDDDGSALKTAGEGEQAAEAEAAAVVAAAATPAAATAPATESKNVVAPASGSTDGAEEKGQARGAEARMARLANLLSLTPSERETVYGHLPWWYNRHVTHKHVRERFQQQQQAGADAEGKSGTNTEREPNVKSGAAGLKRPLEKPAGVEGSSASSSSSDGGATCADCDWDDGDPVKRARTKN